MMQRIAGIPQPVIAQVHGIATAAGCQLVASCDLAVAAEGTRFGVNGVNLGLFCSTPMVALTRAIAPRAAFELLVTGEFIDAERARELGLVNRVVPQAGLMEAARDMAARILRSAPLSVAAVRETARLTRHMPLAQAYATMRAGGFTAMARAQASADALEGPRAAVEKRDPIWSGR